MTKNFWAQYKWRKNGEQRILKVGQRVYRAYEDGLGRHDCPYLGLYGVTLQRLKAEVMKDLQIKEES